MESEEMDEGYMSLMCQGTGTICLYVFLNFPQSSVTRYYGLTYAHPTRTCMSNP